MASDVERIAANFQRGLAVFALHLAAAAENCPTGAIEKALAKKELSRRGL
jgi:hypothetical protein